MKKAFIVFSILIFVSLFSGVYGWAGEEVTPSSEASPVSQKPSDDSELSKKLDKIMNNQIQILKELDEIKSEVEIVKIRASSR